MQPRFQYAIQKVLVWSSHALIWVGLTAYAVSNEADLEWGLFNTKENTLFWPVCYGTLFNAVLFYGNARWLMPRWIKQRNQYLVYAACAVLIITGLETWIDVWYALRQAPIIENTRQLFRDKMNGSWSDEYLPALLAVSSFFLNLFLHTLFWAISLALGLYRDHQQQEKTQDILLKEKMRAELNYLRAQINPHFLFNGINSIYHLIDHDTEKAKDLLLRFSGLLRYQLYECSGDSIALGKELDYLENYVNLEKIRKGSDAVVEYTITAGQTSWKIAPMLLTPLVENAFKYLTQHSNATQNRLHIELSVENDRLELWVKNTFQPEITGLQNIGGLGLENVRTRLSLLYPGKHRLETFKEADTFHARLQIHLDHA